MDIMAFVVIVELMVGSFIVGQWWEFKRLKKQGRIRGKGRSDW